MSEGLTEPKRKLVHHMLFGIQVSLDIKPSEITRSLDEEIKLIKTENRLSRNMQDTYLREYINKKLLEQTREKIERNTVLAAALTDIEKLSILINTN